MAAGDDARFAFVSADLSSMATATRVAGELAATLSSLAFLAFTVVVLSGHTRVHTAEGVELDMAISHLCRLAMFRALQPLISRRVRLWQHDGWGPQQ